MAVFQNAVFLKDAMMGRQMSSNLVGSCALQEDRMEASSPALSTQSLDAEVQSYSETPRATTDIEAEGHSSDQRSQASKKRKRETEERDRLLDIEREKLEVEKE